MRYDFKCSKCKEEFIASHPMNTEPWPPKQQCPKCNSWKTTLLISETAGSVAYIKGNGWLDVKGRRRDMNLYKLQNDDPYGHMRQPGEKDELAAKIRKGGKHNPKPKNFYVDGVKKK